MKVLRRSNTSTSHRTSSSSAVLSWIHLRSLLAFASSSVAEQGRFKSPWYLAHRNGGFSRHYWNSLFTSDGRFCDGGIKFLRKARTRGINPSIRSEVWPFLLGLYDLNSSELERTAVKVRKWKEYEKLRRKCLTFSNHRFQRSISVTTDKIYNEVHHNLIEDPWSEDYSVKFPSSVTWNSNRDGPVYDRTPNSSPVNFNAVKDEENSRKPTYLDAFLEENNSSDSEFSCELLKTITKPNQNLMSNSFVNMNVEDFRTWQRIIRLDALRADPEWVIYSPSTQAKISKELSHHYAKVVGLQDYDHLRPCIIYHASRLVSVLEAYAIYDPEIGYCQGMSDLLSPILAVMEDDYMAFWCFVGFMSKARQNFRLDEFGIRRQLGIVSQIIRFKDARLYRHLEKLHAEDCFFVYRMVLVLFRRELKFEQTLCLWEVLWADQTAKRMGIGGFACGGVRLRAPPTDDLLLYVVAGCILKRRKFFTEKYSNMDEIMRVCNNMAGKLDVWRLLDDAHDLVVNLHDKIKLSL